MTPATATATRGVLADSFAGGHTRDVLLVIAGALLTAACAQISIHVPGSPVPVTGQTFAVIVAGSALGSMRGGASQLLYVVLGLVAPVYAGGTHGWAVIQGVDGGYLIGFVIAGYAVGRLAELGGDRRVVTASLAFAVGQLIIFGVGVPWLKASAALSWPTAIHEGFTVFIVGGVIKAIAAGLLAPAAWRVVHRRRP